jgi:hypothetical protein
MRNSDVKGQVALYPGPPTMPCPVSCGMTMFRELSYRRPPSSEGSDEFLINSPTQFVPHATKYRQLFIA